MDQIFRGQFFPGGKSQSCGEQLLLREIYFSYEIVRFVPDRDFMSEVLLVKYKLSRWKILAAARSHAKVESFLQ